MNTPILPPLRRGTARATRSARRSEFAAIAPFRPAPPADAAHDFLVPNPRPDLTEDPQLLRMLEVR